MKTRDSRLKKLRQKVAPRDKDIQIVWIDTEAGLCTGDGETMTKEEYDRRYPKQPGDQEITIAWSDGDDD